MQILPTTNSPLANLTAQSSAAAVAATARLIAGDTTGLPIGALLAGAVTRVDNNEVTLNVVGKQLTIRTGLTLNVGDALALSVAPNGQLEIARPAVATAASPSTALPLDPTAEIVGEILRQEKPQALGESLPALRNALAEQIPTTREAATVATKVAAVLENMLPDSPRPTNSQELTALVKDGGQFLEAKLERRANGETVNFRSDLKAVLSELVAVVPGLAVARTTLEGIEHQQAANVLSQQSSGAFVVPIPFPDGAQWRTLHLAIEPEPDSREDSRERSEADPNAKFRLLMHVPLSELGETYVDAGMDGGSVRAIVYLESSLARERLRPDLPSLETDLRASGFRDVLLDIRPVSELPERRKQQADGMRSGRTDRTSVVDVRV